mgnify:CR=1 FL=1
MCIQLGDVLKRPDVSKILRVDLATLAVNYEDVPEKYALLGGRGLASVLIADEACPVCSPLGSIGKIVIAPGMASGIPSAGSDRLSVGTGSPFGGGVESFRAGGTCSRKLSHLGIKAVVIQGVSRHQVPFLLKISRKGVDLIPTLDLAGKSAYQTCAALWARYGEVGIISIAQEGERLVASAGISTNRYRDRPVCYRGGGGLGAVLGSKGLRAIVVDDARVRNFESNHPLSFRPGASQLGHVLDTRSLTSWTPSRRAADQVNAVSGRRFQYGEA